MRKSIYLSVVASFISMFSATAQITSTPCPAVPLPISCSSNTINLTSAFTNSGVINPSTANGVGCNSVGNDITAGQIGGPGNSQEYDGWFTTTANAQGIVDVYAGIVSGDPVVGIYSGPCTALTLLTCDDDGGTGLDANATATGLTPGATYWVRVWGYNGGTGTYTITSNGGTPPANDACVSATGLTLNAAVIGGTNYCATVAPGDWNDCESNTENNVWYSFTTTSEGAITVNFGSIACFGSGQGIDVSVFSGNCGAFSTYGCTSVNAGSTGSIPTFTGPAGTYYVMVDGNNSGGATALCTFNVDVDFVGCPAEAGTVAPATPITVCAGTDFTLSTAGSVNTNLGTNPCIGWGYWVASDPLGIFPGMLGIGNLPTGNNPAGVGGDPNYAGVWTSVTNPLANGPNPTLPWEGNGVTYYVAPITLSNCSTGEITTNCFDIGNVTTVYQNPEIVFATVIDCDNVSVGLNTEVSMVVAGGFPSVNGSNFTLTNLGGGVLSSITVADGGTVTVTGIPNGGTFSVLITDGAGCSETVTLGPINASTYCPACGVDAGDVNNVQTGSGNTIANNGINGSPFILCYGDNLSMTHLNNYVLPANLNICGNPPGPSFFNGATPGSCNPGIVYGIFTGLATVANPFNDPAFSGFGFIGEDQNFLNDGGLIAALISNSIPIVNNTFYLYPVTADVTNIDINSDGLLDWSEDFNGDGCVDSGNPITITMLNPIETSVQNTCNGPVITIAGGHPEFFTSFYAITNNGAGTITGTPVTHNGMITITGLTNGSPYSITITDFNGCPHTVTGTYNWINPTPVILNLASSFCEGDPIDNFNGTPIANTVTTGSFNINFVSDGFCNEWTWVVRDAFNTIVASGNTLTCTLANGVALPSILVSGLNPANGPFTLTLTDAFGDGQDGSLWVGGGIGSTTVINNITGNTVGFTSGNWGTSITLNLGGFVSTTTTFSGVDVTNTGNGTASFNPNTVGTHVITITHDNGEGCIYTATQNVTVHPNPLLGSVTNPTICSGQTILLSNFVPGEANGVAGTGVWYVGTNNTGALASTGAITPVNGAQYYYEYTATAGGCRDGEVLTVTVNPTPAVPTISSTAASCSSAEVSTISNFSGSNSYTFSPTGPTVGAGGVISGMTASTNYTVTATLGTCTSNASAVFNNDPILTTPAVPTISSTAATCSAAGTSTVSNYSASNTYTFSPTGPSVGIGGAIIGMTLGTNFTVTATLGACTSAASITFSNAATLPTPVVSGSGPVCVGSTITLSPTTGGTWISNSPAIASVTNAGVVTGLSAGTSTFTFTNTATTCSNTTTSITVNALPVITIPSPATVCIGATANLTPTTGGTWVSSNPTVATINNGGVVTGVAGGTANMTFTNATTGCSNPSGSASITVNTLPTLPTAPTMTQSACALSTGSLTGAVAAGNGTLSYSWTNSSSVVVGTTANLTNIPAGTYNLTITDGNGCSQLFGPYSVTNPGSPAAPTVVVSDNSVCVGESFTLTASSGAASPTFQWTGPNSSSATNVLTISSASLADNGSYSVTVTSANCTSTATTVSVAVNANPVASAGANTTVNCLNPTPTLTATGGTSYSWNTPSGTVSGATINLTTSSTAGTYTVTATDANGCTDDDAITVTIDVTTPTALVATPAQINCTTPSITLDGTGSTNTAGTTVGLTYTWTAANGGSISSGANTASPSVSSAGDYTLTVTQANGCTNAVTVSVSADAGVPVANIATPGVLNCTNSTLVLDGTGSTGSGLTYAWTTTGGTIDSGASSSSATISAPGTYTLTIEASNGCTNVTSVVVTQDLTAPTTSVAAPIEVDCSNPTITLDGSASTSGGTITYAWTTSNGTITGSTTGNTATVTSAGDYTLTVTNTANGCTSNQQVTVTENTTLPVANAGANVNLTCASTTVALDGTASSGAGITYSWTGPSVVSGGNTATPSVGQAGTYTLTVTGANGCTATSTVDVIPDANAPIADAGNNMVIDCNNATVILDGSGSDAAADITYTWTTTNGNIISGTTSNQATVDAAGTYTIEVVNTTNGCSSFASVNVTVDTAPPTANAGSAQVVSCATPTVTLDGTGSTGTGLTYSWTTATGNIVGAANTATVVADAAGTYTLIVTGSNGCTNSTTVDVTGNTTVPTAAVATAGSMDCDNTPIQLDGSGSTGSNITYAWTTTNGTITSGGNTATPTVSSSGDYTLIVTGDNGCSSAAVTVTVGSSDDLDCDGDGVTNGDEIADGTDPNDPCDFVAGSITLPVTTECLGDLIVTIPSIFTPNGDGSNDIFRPTVINAISMQANIFNRWGQLMYEWDGTSGGWDGRTIAGVECSEATYFYLFYITDKDNEILEYKGHFALNR